MKSSVILGIGGLLGHDANAALVADGQILAAAQEERFSRKKHDGSFPKRAIESCLQQANLNPEAITDVVFAEKPFQSLLFSRTGALDSPLNRWIGRFPLSTLGGPYYNQARKRFPDSSFHYAWHHLSHAAGAYYSSPFTGEAAFLCIDGKGESYNASAGIVGQGKTEWLWEQPYENGIGLLYTLVTRFLGFHSFGSEYKVMGLAPFGRPTLIAPLESLFATDECGGLRLVFDGSFAWERQTADIDRIAEAIGHPARTEQDAITPSHADVAASLQAIFEREIFKMARFVRKETGSDRLLFCGGCAQNCVAAGKLRRQNIFKEVFNSPVGGDMGSGLGAALLLQGTRRPGSIQRNHRGFYLGPEPGPAPESIGRWQVQIKSDLHDHVARELAGGKIVGWVRGGMELGARALGARSILADPRNPDMQRILNLKVKFRESFRPFAPIIMAEHTGDWFDSTAESDYMNYTANLKESLRLPGGSEGGSIREQLHFHRCDIPSVVHVDFSARLQTVRPEVHPDLHRLLQAFYEETKVPILINTSFNVSGQPIVCTAQEAWDCFVNTDMDLLVINNELYRNPQEKTREEKIAWLEQFRKDA